MRKKTVLCRAGRCNVKNMSVLIIIYNVEPDPCNVLTIYSLQCIIANARGAKDVYRPT